jgi:hypothetical protein
MGNTIKRTKTRNDVIFIAVLLAFVVIVGSLYVFTRKDGNTVTVTVDGKFFGEYSLNEDRIVEIRVGECFNLLLIEGGKARVAKASCPDGVCAMVHSISHDGESIICLPNRVIVTVTLADEDAPDIIV